jgi:ABC-type lipoprotein export system ATPase subunit
MEDNPDNHLLPPQAKGPPLPMKLSQNSLQRNTPRKRVPLDPRPSLPPMPIRNKALKSNHLNSPQASSPPFPIMRTRQSFSSTKSAAITPTHQFTEPAIIVENLNKSYPDGTIGLKDVSLKLFGGELTCIAGESGHGKTTLLRLLALDDKATDGRIVILSQDLSQLRSRERDDLRGEAIEYIPQGHLGLVARTALMNVAYWLHYYDALQWNKAKEVARQTLRDAGLPHDKFDVHVRRLSGGQRARVAIAKAFARNRPICLGDEIFAALDLQSAIDLIRLFRALARRGAAVVVIVHHEHLREYFDRVLIMRDKCLVEDRYNSNPRT